MIFTELRAGGDRTLYMFPGAGAEASELFPLSRSLRADFRVVAITPAIEDLNGSRTTVEELSAKAVSAIRVEGERDPYLLLGYSAGGVLALEVARQLEVEGVAVGFLGLIDTVYDRRFWSSKVFVGSQVNRAIHQIGETLGQPAKGSVRELGPRCRRLAERVRQRISAPDTGADMRTESQEEILLAIVAKWRPYHVTSRVVMFVAHESVYGCEVLSVWRPWMRDVVEERIPGSHLSLINDPVSVGLLARAVERRIDGSTLGNPRALVATAFRWTGAARLATELRVRGWIVEVVAPSSNPSHRISAVTDSWRLSTTRPIASLENALAHTQADMIIPFDDRIRQSLQLVYARADPGSPAGMRTRGVIERSLGNPEHFSTLYSRFDILAIAEELGIRCPPTAPVKNVRSLLDWMALHPGPCVLKTDGSWGGRGVAMIERPCDVYAAWRRLSVPAPFFRAAKRLIVERDPWPIRDAILRQAPRVSVQEFIRGRSANVTLSCLNGRVLAASAAEVVQSSGATGPSTVLRLIDCSEMIASASALVRHLGISGLCGVDFVIDEKGRPHLLEINPRATPTSHLLTIEGSDPLDDLRTALGYESLSVGDDRERGDIIALFPQELTRDPKSLHLVDAFHDIPLHAPDFLDISQSELRRGRIHCWTRFRPVRTLARMDDAECIGEALG